MTTLFYEFGYLMALKKGITGNLHIRNIPFDMKISQK